jgi:hypothetical protein
LLLDLFFPEATSRIPDVLHNPRVDFLSPQATSRIPDVLRDLRNPKVDFFFRRRFFSAPRRPPASRTWD